jgi:uncharacterized protein
MNNRKLSEALFGKQILSLIAFMGIGIMAVTLLCYLIIPSLTGQALSEFATATNYNDANYMKGFIVMQSLSSIGMFVLPAFLFGYYAHHSSNKYLGIMVPQKPMHVTLSIFAVLSSLFFVALLGEWNAKMPLPKSWVDLEDTATALTKAILNIKTIPKLLLTLFYVALLPAFGEELFFRGCLQNIFVSAWGKKNIDIIILLTAIIFALMHGQMVSALPRVFLGIVLGYIYYYSGSIWVGVLAHAVNNGLQVWLSYLHNTHQLSFDPNADTQVKIWQGAISVVLCFVFMYLIKKTNVPYTEYPVKKLYSNELDNNI